MTPILLVCPPRSKGSLLVRILNATPGIQMAGESDGALSAIRGLQIAREKAEAGAAAESWPRRYQPQEGQVWRAGVAAMLRTWTGFKEGGSHYGLRSSFLGRENWDQACDWWSWFLEMWPEGRIVFLTRDQGEIELSMLATSPLWIPAYGKCVGCCGTKVKNFLKSMRDFHAMNPSSTTLLDASDLDDYSTTAAALGRIGISVCEDGWAEQLAIHAGGRKSVAEETKQADDPNPFFRAGLSWDEAIKAAQSEGVDIEIITDGEVDEPGPSRWDGEGSLVPEGYTAETWAAFRADPFGDQRRDVPADYIPKAPAEFVEFPAWHERAIVYPWLSTGAAWEELRYSLRSIERHFVDKECPIYVIGDQPPPWLQPGGRVRFLPVDYASGKNFKEKRTRGLWQARTIGLQLAERVLWMMDDLFLLRDCDWSDFEIPFSDGRLSSKPEAKGSGWLRSMEFSRRDLVRAGIQHETCFSSHAPRLFEREPMLTVLRRFHVPFSGGLENLYGNVHWRGERPMEEYRSLAMPASAGKLWANLNDNHETLSRGPVIDLFDTPAPWEIASTPQEIPVPKIIHQTWKTEDFPRSRYPQEWQDSWREQHPDWQYRFWTDADILELARRYYPEFVEVIQKARGIVKSDLGRLLIIHRYGGVYADLDYQALKPLDSLLVGGEAFVSSFARAERVYIHNALFAARPGHPMILDLALKALDRTRQNIHGAAEWISGPEVFTQYAPAWNPVHLPAGLVCPIDWVTPRSEWKHIEGKAAESFPQAHAVTWWKHGWK